MNYLPIIIALIVAFILARITYKLMRFFTSESTVFEKSKFSLFIYKITPSLVVFYYSFMFLGKIIEVYFKN
jgi:hypothetical protein